MIEQFPARIDPPRRSLRALAFLFARSLASAAILLAPAVCAAQRPIVIGFVGGFVHRDDVRHGEVQVAERLRANYGERVQVAIFENRNRAEAHAAVLHWLDRNKNGRLTPEEKHGTPIILFGHSWGASTVVLFARELQKEDIPVLLTVQVDSVNRRGEDDSLIPPNVAEAVNFYQDGGFLHTRSRIIAADPDKTKILGNYRFHYDKEPAECSKYPWYDRLLFSKHIAMDCDPAVWSKVENLIRAHLR